MPDDPQVIQILEALRRAGLVRVNDIEKRRDALRGEIELALAGKPPGIIAFPACSDVLLATITSKQNDEVARIFGEYFTFSKHSVVPRGSPVLTQLDEALTACVKPQTWPSNCCVPADCVTLCGTRHRRPPLPGGPGQEGCLHRIYAADAVWLFYMNRMALPEILGALLDDYNTRGRFPIFSDSLEGIVAETMIKLIKTGEASSVKDRCLMLLRSLGWKTDVTDKLGLTTTENAAFKTQWLAFLRLASEYFRYNRLRDAIQATTDPTRPSTATLTAIRDTIGLLKKSFDAFDYGRNASITLSGIVWIVATLGLVRNLRKQLGIPESYEQPYEFIPAAYELLVVGRPSTPSETNRFTLHLDAARYGRRILLDIQALNLETAELTELEAWLLLVEAEVEGLRAAHRSITGVDLGTEVARA